MTGTKCIDLTDRSRKEKLSSNRDDLRRLKVRFYYPGKDDPDKAPAKMLRENVLKGLEINDLDFSFYHQRVKVYEDLEIADGCFPLILFSHGYGACAEQNSDLFSQLADKGFIIASIDHTYEAADVVFEDGTVIDFDTSLMEKMHKTCLTSHLDDFIMYRLKHSPKRALRYFDRHQRRYDSFMMERLEEWVKDDLFVLSQMHEMAQDRGSLLYQKIDFSKGVGAMGHSFGGAAAYHHCVYADEISCGVNMDGSLYGDYGDRINHKPFMQIVANDDINTVARAFLYHDKPLHYLSFADMAHLGFTDLKFVTHNKDYVGTSDPIKTMDTLNSSIVAFFERYLKKGDTENSTKFDIDESVLLRYEVM